MAHPKLHPFESGGREKGLKNPRGDLIVKRLITRVSIENPIARLSALPHKAHLMSVKGSAPSVLEAVFYQAESAVFVWERLQ